MHLDAQQWRSQRERLVMEEGPAQHGVLAHKGRNLIRTVASVIGWGGVAAAITIGPLAAAPLAAQEPPRIQVAPTITAVAPSQAALSIEVSPPGTVPQKSFVSVRGLPSTVTLTGGQAAGPGLWVVPLSSLPGLKVHIPGGASGQSDVTVSLIAMNGRLLAQAKTTLVIVPAAADTGAAKMASSPPARVEGTAAPMPEPTPIEAPGAASAPPAPVLQEGERARAEHLLVLGEAYLADANVIGARDFFERAADAGLPAAALRMAATYDPNELGRLKAHGVAPDLALARKWYERARELGATEAAERLARLSGN
jgi:hypothetical protein